MMNMNEAPYPLKQTDVVEFCANLDKPLIYIPNHGNLGDSLIATGTKMAFEATGVGFQSIELFNESPDAVVLYAGGGNLVPYYNNCAKFLSVMIQHHASVVVLPHTVYGHQDLIKRMDDRHHIFCRERPSFEYVNKLNSAKTYFDHDLALKINPDILFSKYAEDIKNAPENLLKLTEFIFRKSIFHSRHHGRIGYLFRSDRESILDKIDHTFDISGVFVHKWKLDEFTTLLTTVFLMALTMFDRIYTDRLHVAIGASILKIPTTLYPNSYYKNKAVFEASLNGLNSCIKFEDNLSSVKNII
jgi:exopolysaccharide biosynthesis predicted pyruvyltransferase EpsI